MGDEYPGAEVLGIDLSPIQPLWVPPNVKFMVDDAESPWLHPPDSFDFVHIRHMCSSIKNWPKLLEQAHKYAITPLDRFTSLTNLLKDHETRRVDRAPRIKIHNTM